MSLTRTWGRAVGKRLDRCPGAVRRGDDRADSFQHHRQHLAGISLVIHHEHADAIETDRRTLCIVNGIGRFNLARAVRPRLGGLVQLEPSRLGWADER